jgi:hypothetical protein
VSRDDSIFARHGKCVGILSEATPRINHDLVGTQFEGIIGTLGRGRISTVYDTDWVDSARLKE